MCIKASSEVHWEVEASQYRSSISSVLFFTTITPTRLNSDSSFFYEKKTANMKFTLITAIATLATVVAGTPTMSALEAREAEAEAAGLVPRVSPPFPPSLFISCLYCCGFGTFGILICWNVFEMQEANCD